MIGSCVLRLPLVLTVCSVASIGGGCRSAAEIDTSDFNVRSPALTAESLPQPGAVTASLPPGAGMDAVRSRCVACHEPAMLRQQRLTAQQWMAEIEKMEGWGAPVSNADKAQMSAYLSMIAGPDNTRFTPATVAPVSAEQPTRDPAEKR